MSPRDLTPEDIASILSDEILINNGILSEAEFKAQQQGGPAPMPPKGVPGQAKVPAAAPAPRAPAAGGSRALSPQAAAPSAPTPMGAQGQTQNPENKPDLNKAKMSLEACIQLFYAKPNDPEVNDRLAKWLKYYKKIHTKGSSAPASGPSTPPQGSAPAPIEGN